MYSGGRSGRAVEKWQNEIEEKKKSTSIKAKF